MTGLILLLLAGLIVLGFQQIALERRLDALQARLEGRAEAPGGDVPEAAEAVAASVDAPADPRSDAAGAGLFERLVGGRLLIWTGGAALVLAAVFLIRYSIEIGLITAEVRMIASGLFGAALLAAGEYAHRRPGAAEDPRISQALVGAGLAVLYATFYGSHILYGFISLGLAGALMVALTVAGLALSLRHGAPTAAMALAGGLLTPLLVGERLGTPALLAYLALLDLGVAALAWRRGWTWLVGLALLGSFAWTASLLFGDPGSALAAGWFALILAVAAGAVPGRHAPGPFALPLATAAAQHGLIVLRDDVGPLGWLQLGATALAALLLARAKAAGPWAPAAVLAVAVAAIPLKAALGDSVWLAAAAAGAILLLGAGPLAFALQRRSAAWGALACLGFAAPALSLRWSEPDLLGGISWGLSLALLALGPAVLAVARRGWETPAAFAPVPALTATFLAAHALADLLPGDVLAVAWAGLAGALILAGMRSRDRELRFAGLLLLTIAVLKLFLVDAEQLEGLLRILSFLGLGIALIGIGRLYGTLLRSAGKVPPPA